MFFQNQSYATIALVLVGLGHCLLTEPATTSDSLASPVKARERKAVNISDQLLSSSTLETTTAGPKAHRLNMLNVNGLRAGSYANEANTIRPTSQYFNVSVSEEDLDASSSREPDDYDYDSPDDLIHNQFVQIFFCIIYTTVFVLGVFGNVLVCYVVLRNRAMQTVTNIFITNLALSDILLCVLAVPFTPLYTFMRRWAFGRTLCHLVSFAQGCSIYISTLTLTSIAIDRYFVIIYPFHPRMKLSTCIAIIVSIWVIALLATVPYGMYMKVVVAEMTVNATTSSLLSINGSSSATNTSHINEHWQLGAAAGSDNGAADSSMTYLTTAAESTSSSAPGAYIQLVNPSSTTTQAPLSPPGLHSYSYLSSTTYCEENWPSEQYRKVFGSVTTIVQFVLPFIIISICYTWVSIKLNARARAKPGSKSSRREEADRDRKKRTNRMLIAMVAVFGLSWLPLNVVNIFDDFYEKSNEWRFYTLFFFVAHSIAMSSTCYNPFLYAWLNENFRKEFKHVLPCFNPSNNNNILNIGRVYNRSDRNTCGPRLRHGSECVGRARNDDDEQDDDNGVTQETTCLGKDKLLIIPREPTYGNGGGTPLSPHSFITNHGVNNTNNSSAVTGRHHVEILLNDANVTFGSGGSNRNSKRSLPQRHHQNNHSDDIDSGDEQTIEMRFCETPFVSSDNTTGISILETSTSNEAERSGASAASTSDLRRVN